MSRVRVSPGQVLDSRVVTAAEQTAQQAIDDLLDGSGQPRGVIVTAPAGAGKSRLVTTGVGRARDRGFRVAVAAPTNEQAFGLVRTISEQHCSRGGGRAVTFVPASNVTLPDPIRGLPGVRECTAGEARGESLIVGTL